MRCYVVMGVSGCGKTTVGLTLSALCGMDFVDGDDLHPTENVAKMAEGCPLTDEDRAPWLSKVGETLRDMPGPAIIGCSALRESYRRTIEAAAEEPVRFVHLTASRDTIARRMSARSGHFMPVSLLDSQFQTLEPLSGHERGVDIDIARPFEAVIGDAEAYVRETLI